MRKVIKIEMEEGETRYLNPSCVKEVKISESQYENATCVTLVLQDDNVITKLYTNDEEKDKFVSRVIDCIERS